MHPYAITDPVTSARPSVLPARIRRQRQGPATHDRTLVLGAVETSPAAARATLRECLSQWHLTHLEDDAQQILSELVANAVAASNQAAPPDSAPAAITVSLAIDNGDRWLRAWDPDPLPRQPTTTPAPGTNADEASSSSRPSPTSGEPPPAPTAASTSSPPSAPVSHQTRNHARTPHDPQPAHPAA